MNVITGVPPDRGAKLLQRYTVPGAITSAVADYEYRCSLNKQQMMDTAKTSFERQYQNALTNPYHVIGATDIYNVGGLGDGDLGDGEWADIVKVFVGEVGRGLGGRISGRDPYQPQQVNLPPPPPPTPFWMKAAIGGGAALLGTFLLISLARR